MPQQVAVQAFKDFLCRLKGASVYLGIFGGACASVNLLHGFGDDGKLSGKVIS